MAIVMGQDQARSEGTRWRRWWALVRHALGPGDEASPAQRARFEELFTRYQGPLLEFLYGMTHDREWAADLAQETALHAFTATRDLASITYPQAWLYRIATNVALNALQRRQRFGWLSLNQMREDERGRSNSPLFPELWTEDIAASIAERDAVWRVLVELPPRWRAVLLLQTVAEFSVREIATQLRLSEANVRKMLFRAKERYRTLHAQFEGGQS